jgi:hypothetical protein
MCTIYDQSSSAYLHDCYCYKINNGLSELSLKINFFFSLSIRQKSLSFFFFPSLGEFPFVIGGVCDFTSGFSIHFSSDYWYNGVTVPPLIKTYSKYMDDHEMYGKYCFP